ncbi:MAG TPA: enoyl-CoA hydratase/isomerase family protein [Pseudonocardia sp.]|nr:enoyl-CoA hydratase/isomerase family protein [Pseudonocardia sp.]
MGTTSRTDDLLGPVQLVNLDTDSDTDLNTGPGPMPAGGRPSIRVGVCTGPVDPARCEPLDVTLGRTGVDARVEWTTGSASDPGPPRPIVAVADPWAEAEALRRCAADNPSAAAVLAAVLRATETLSVEHALEVESLAYSTLLGGPEFNRWLRARPPGTPPADVAEAVSLSRVDRAGADELRITLNRPERRNAYGRQMRDELVAALRLPDHDPTIARILLDGAGPAFCAGGDLAEFGTAPDPVTAHLIRTRAGAALPLHRLAGRIEVRLHGWCVGAGVELPAFAGRVVAAPDARFRLPELAMGLIPGAGGTVSLPRRIGRWRTFYLALTGRTVDAATALSWGLVDEVVAG